MAFNDSEWRRKQLGESVYDDILKAIPNNHSYKKLAVDIKD